MNPDQLFDSMNSKAVPYKGRQSLSAEKDQRQEAFQHRFITWRRVQGQRPMTEADHNQQNVNTIPSDPEELGKLINRSVQAGLPGFAAVCRAMKFYQEGRRLERPFQKAQRFALAWETVNRAIEYGDSRVEAMTLRKQLAERGDAWIISCINGVHDSFQRKLNTCTSRQEQALITGAAFDELWKFHENLQDRLIGLKEWRKVLRSRVEYWQTQFNLLNDKKPE